MSNLNTNLNANPTTITQHEALTMDNVNKPALVSSIASELFHYDLNERISLITAVAFVGALDYIDNMEDFEEAFIDGLENTTMDIKGYEIDDHNMDGDLIMKALVDANYLLPSGEMGTRLAELVACTTSAYKPALASEGVERRFGYSKVQHSPLSIEAVHALEDTPYTIDTEQLSLALKVQAKLGGEEKDQESYVLRGCQLMDNTLAYVSEFKMDNRGRLNQAACHGPNGQSSDRSRSLMDLYGVPVVYDVQAVKKVIMAEIEDMVSDVKASAKQLREMGDVDFVVLHVTHPDSPVKKPWSFVKAARIMRELQAGNMPYVGMAVGLDAKCSGPQLGALMVGDQEIAAACGMTMEELDDAYELCMVHLEKAGFTGFTRAGIKSAYMGVFYGQGYAAFTDINNMVKEEQFEIIDVLYGEARVPSDDVAKRFHKAVTSSFGAKMIGVRNLVRQYSKITKGRTKHFMPDGFEVAMNYKVKTNVLGEMMEFGTETPDVLLRNNSEFYKFINFQMRSRDTHEGDFARNGFVNMIQATDALIARLIIVHAKRLGAKHIISIHDCFRVNVTEMHILEQAIKNAYHDLFGSEFNNSTEDLPMGTDILGLYFQGANRQLIDQEDAMMVTQFFSSNKRRMRKVNGVKVTDLIDALGTTYYFAK